MRTCNNGIRMSTKWNLNVEVCIKSCFVPEILSVTNGAAHLQINTVLSLSIRKHPTLSDKPFLYWQAIFWHLLPGRTHQISVVWQLDWWSVVTQHEVETSRASAFIVYYIKYRRTALHPSSAQGVFLDLFFFFSLNFLLKYHPNLCLETLHFNLFTCPNAQPRAICIHSHLHTNFLLFIHQWWDTRSHIRGSYSPPHR